MHTKDRNSMAMLRYNQICEIYIKMVSSLLTSNGHVLVIEMSKVKKNEILMKLFNTIFALLRLV